MSPIRLLVVFLVYWLAACSTPDNSEPPAELTTIENPIGLQLVWANDTGRGVYRASHRLAPWVINKQVFSLDARGVISVYQADDGTLLNRVETGLFPYAGLTGNQELLVITSREGDIQVRERSGDFPIIWHARVLSEIRAIPVLDQQRLYVRSTDGRLLAFSLKTGQQLWAVDRSVPTLSLTGNSQPLLYRGLVLIGFDNGKLLAVDAVNGQTQWEATLAVPRGRSELERLVDIDANLVAADGVIYAVAFQGRLMALDAGRGQELWSRELSAFQAITLDGDVLYLTDARDHIWAIDRRNGAALWKQTALQWRKLTAPVLVGDYLVVSDFEGYQHWLSRQDGSLRGRISLSEHGLFFPEQVYQSHVISTDITGDLYVVQQASDSES